MKYAIIQSGNKQYKVSEGDIIEVEQLSVKPQEAFTFNTVLLFADGNNRQVGTPSLSNIIVSGQVIGNGKGKKVRVAKFKAKSRYRRVTGFRSSNTKIKIETIGIKTSNK